MQVKEPPGVEKVCGSDAVTYDNECALKRASCTSQTLINISYVGACGKQHIFYVSGKRKLMSRCIDIVTK